MPYFKDTDGRLHFLDSAAFEHLLPAGCVQITDAEAAELLVPPPPTAEQLVASYEQQLDAHLDGVAQQHRFKDRHSLALRAGYPSPYQPLGLAFAEWMDGCNFAAYQRLQRVMLGEEPMPSVEQFLADLPEFVVP